MRDLCEAMFHGPIEGPYFISDPVADSIRLGTRTNDVLLMIYTAPMYYSQHAREKFRFEDLPNYVFTRDRRDLCPRRNVHHVPCSLPTRRYVSENQKIHNHQKEIK